MTRARDEIVSMDITPYYHVYSRCVRRVFLCGYDAVSKRDYEHSRQWVVDRLRLLSFIFAIDGVNLCVAGTRRINLHALCKH